MITPPPARPRERTCVASGAAQGAAQTDAARCFVASRASARSCYANSHVQRCEAGEAGRAVYPGLGLSRSAAAAQG